MTEGDLSREVTLNFNGTIGGIEMSLKSQTMEIREKIRDLTSELETLESNETEKRNQHLVGKYLRSTSPDWTSYVFIKKVQGRSAYGTGFYGPTKGRAAIYFDFDAASSGQSRLEEYREISKDQFIVAWGEVVSRINGVMFE